MRYSELQSILLPTIIIALAIFLFVLILPAQATHPSISFFIYEPDNDCFEKSGANPLNCRVTFVDDVFYASCPGAKVPLIQDCDVTCANGSCGFEGFNTCHYGREYNNHAFIRQYVCNEGIEGEECTGGENKCAPQIIDSWVCKTPCEGDCSYSLVPSSATYPPAGGTGFFSVDADDNSCEWDASESLSWASITGGSFGTGDGTVNYSVSANTGAARAGDIIVEDVESGFPTDFTINQNAGAGCAAAGTGTGLVGDFYDGINHDTLVSSGKTFANLGITSINQNPADVIYGTNFAGGPDTFSVRFTGQVQARCSENYTFRTVHDDGVRLWVNGNLIINNWSDGGTINDGNYSMVAGQKYDIVLEYYENSGDARLRLAWLSPSTPVEAIPRSQLYPPLIKPNPDVSVSISAINGSSPTSLANIKSGDVLTFKVIFRNQTGADPATAFSGGVDLSNNLVSPSNFSCVACAGGSLTDSVFDTFRWQGSLTGGSQVEMSFAATVNTQTNQKREILTVDVAGNFEPGPVPFNARLILLASPGDPDKPIFREIPP